MATAVAGAATAAAAAVVPEVYARDAMIAWFRGEFAAANAIIDALCSHLAQIGGAAEYEAVFAAVHRRRLNWIPVLHMQKYYSIADVAAELRVVAANREVASFDSAAEDPTEAKQLMTTPEEDKPVESGGAQAEEEHAASEESVVDGVGIAVEEEAAAEEEPAAAEAAAEEEPAAVVEEAAADEVSSGDSSDHKGTEGGNAKGGSQEEHQEGQISFNEVNICVGHEDCLARPERIKILKGFVAKESVKGHMASSILPSLGTLSVNVVKGLKLYEDIFTNSELLTLADYVNELRLAGRGGELSGETFIFFNKQMKGNKREIIQLGVPLFQSTTKEAASNIEPIPTALQTVIDHLVQWRLIPESRKPNSCIINFFDEDEHSQPYFKPPHLDNPISTLLLSGTTMAFGRSLVSDHEGNYKGPLTLSINEGSLLVMRGNSADMARHVVCASPNRRIIITFVKVRAASHPTDSPMALQQPTKTMALWQPAQKVATTGVIACGPHAMIPAAWGLALRSPVVMLPPPRAMVMSPNKKAPRGGTGVFLPWTVGPKKYTRHLPPRIQKRRLPSLPSPLEVRA
ncbi:hypothetical protein C4D60_Mb08t05400 [Musa balbisiana]|uniref:Fe2OG dioxygenase domain-containing protein n=1 Tax=Musa balbisiana TaxID=52838 RepID=A0A4S8K1K6_MUSBA|nr:hypothetical protein C4D60_Mb08t05400 [Musa balbisiana]